MLHHHQVNFHNLVRNSFRVARITLLSPNIIIVVCSTAYRHHTNSTTIKISSHRIINRDSGKDNNGRATNRISAAPSSTNNKIAVGNSSNRGDTTSNSSNNSFRDSNRLSNKILEGYLFSKELKSLLVVYQSRSSRELCQSLLYLS